MSQSYWLRFVNTTFKVGPSPPDRKGAPQRVKATPDSHFGEEISCVPQRVCGALFIFCCRFFFFCAYPTPGHFVFV